MTELPPPWLVFCGACYLLFGVATIVGWLVR